MDGIDGHGGIISRIGGKDQDRVSDPEILVLIAKMMFTSRPVCSLVMGSFFNVD
jgi:hypothetical protein